MAGGSMEVPLKSRVCKFNLSIRTQVRSLAGRSGALRRFTLALIMAAGCAHQDAQLAASTRLTAASPRASATASPVSVVLPAARTAAPVVLITVEPAALPAVPAPVAAAAPPIDHPAQLTHEREPAPIPLRTLAGDIEPIRGDDPTLPEPILAASRGKVLEGTYKMCIHEGKVQSVTPVVSIQGADRCVMDTLKTWQFPKLSLRLCKLQSLRFEIP